MESKYLGSTGLAKFLENLFNVFSRVGHTHDKSQITDFPTIPSNVSQLTNDSGFVTAEQVTMIIPVESSLSDTSENPVQNKVIKAKFDSVDGQIETHAHSWNDLQDKPFDVSETRLYTYTYNGAILETVGTYNKVSDTPLNISNYQYISIDYTSYTSGYSDTEKVYAYELTGYPFARIGFCAINVYDECEIDGNTFSRGLWITTLRYVTSIRGMSVKYISENAIPNSIARVKDVVKTINYGTPDGSGNINLDVGVRSINYNHPDENGNISLEIGASDIYWENIQNKPFGVTTNYLEFIPYTNITLTDTNGTGIYSANIELDSSVCFDSSKSYNPGILDRWDLSMWPMYPSYDDSNNLYLKYGNYMEDGEFYISITDTGNGVFTIETNYSLYANTEICIYVNILEEYIQQIDERLIPNSFVKSINYNYPDSNGNVDLTGYATEQFIQDGYQPKGNYLESTALPTAVNDALAQAKASGEFNGADGKDGVSPTVAVSKTGKITTITITDVNGTKTATINDGEDGTSSGGNTVPMYYASNEPSGITDDFLFDYSEIETNGEAINVGDWIVTPSGKVYVVTFVEDYGIEAVYDETLHPDSGENVDLEGYATEQWVKDQKYLTEVPEGYAKTTDIPTKPEDIGALPNTYTPPNQTAEQVGADPKGTAASVVSQHNTADDSHNDIRLELKAINDRLTAFFDSDNQTLDELSEIVAYITSNKSLIDSITTSKVSVADIINNLTSNVTNKPLSAAQGVVLKGLIDTLSGNLANYQPKGDYALRSELPTVPTKVSAFTNDAGYLTQHQDISGKVNKNGLTLGIHSDGLVYVFVDGVPVGNGIEMATNGDVFGYVDENGNIIVQGNLPDGTYSVKYEIEDGSTIDIGDLVLDSNVYYTVTNNLTNCTNSNGASEVIGGQSYSAVITANSGYELSSVTVTMGGNPVTVSGGSISIAEVTGDIVITAVAEESGPAYSNLAEADPDATGEAAWNSGGWCNDSYMAGTSYAYRAATDGRITTNTFAVEHGDIIYVKGIKYSEGTDCQLAGFDSSGAYIKHTSAYNMCHSQGCVKDLTGTVGEDYWSFKNAGSGNSDVGTRFIRIAGYPSGSISDIIITRNQPIV